jgi:hypothetical protein
MSNFYLLFMNFKATLIGNLRRVYKLLDMPLFISMARFLLCFLMHVLEYVLDRLSNLFKFNNYPLGEKAYSVMFHIAGLSFRDVSER